MGALSRILGIDYGGARIGVAISDPLGITARGLETLRWNGRDATKALSRLCELIDTHGVSRVVIGQPRRTDGRESETQLEAEAFAAELGELSGATIIWCDERYTTRIAHRLLSELSFRGDRRAVIDQVAASIILQDYLDEQAATPSTGGAML